MSIRVYKTLRSGDSNLMVRALQQALPAWAWPSPIAYTSIDGVYGKNTISAVSNYQRELGLTSDGVAGRDTLSSLGLWADVVRGIDISDYQTGIDWDLVWGSGIAFIVIKASEGATWKAQQFPSHYLGAVSTGLRVGAYHFAKMQGNTPYSELQNFIEAVGNRTLSGPIALDLEVSLDTPPEENLMWVESWLSGAAKHFKTLPYVYTSNRIITQSFGTGKGLEKYPLWTPRYPEQPLNINPWKQWNIWQYTNKGMVAGISGDVDMNYMVV
jgi:hypothetical protein